MQLKLVENSLDSLKFGQEFYVITSDCYVYQKALFHQQQMHITRKQNKCVKEKFTKEISQIKKEEVC